MAQLTPSRSGLSPLRQGARIRLTSHEGEVIKSTRQGATQLAPSRGQSPKTGGMRYPPSPTTLVVAQALSSATTRVDG